MDYAVRVLISPHQPTIWYPGGVLCIRGAVNHQISTSGTPDARVLDGVLGGAFHPQCDNHPDRYSIVDVDTAIRWIMHSGVLISPHMVPRT